MVRTYKNCVHLGAFPMGSDIVEIKKEGILLGIEGVFSPFSAFSSPASVPSPFSSVCSSISPFLHLLGAPSLHFRGYVLRRAKCALRSTTCALRFLLCYKIPAALFIFLGRSPFSMISSHLELTSLSRSHGPKYGQCGPDLLLNRSIWGILGFTLSRNPKFPQ